MVLMTAFEVFVFDSCREFFKANHTTIVFCPSFKPHLWSNSIYLLLRVTSVDVTSCTLLEAEKLLIVHVIDIRAIGISTSRLFWFFYCSLNQSLLFSFCRSHTSSTSHNLHQHASLGYSLFNLVHRNRHLNLPEIVSHLSRSLSFSLCSCTTLIKWIITSSVISVIIVWACLSHAAWLELESNDLTLQFSIFFLQFSVIFFIGSKILVFLW